MDRGPQFRGHFVDFCGQYGIEHEQSSPYNARSNGLIEANVRSLKNLVCKVRQQQFEDAFSIWKNFERPGKNSPNELFFGRKL